MGRYNMFVGRRDAGNLRDNNQSNRGIMGRYIDFERVEIDTNAGYVYKDGIEDSKNAITSVKIDAEDEFITIGFKFECDSEYIGFVDFNLAQTSALIASLKFFKEQLRKQIL
jgi:hypothetical protein